MTTQNITETPATTASLAVVLDREQSTLARLLDEAAAAKAASDGADELLVAAKVRGDNERDQEKLLGAAAAARTNADAASRAVDRQQEIIARIEQRRVTTEFDEHVAALTARQDAAVATYDASLAELERLVPRVQQLLDTMANSRNEEENASIALQKLQTPDDRNPWGHLNALRIPHPGGYGPMAGDTSAWYSPFGRVSAWLSTLRPTPRG